MIKRVAFSKILVTSALVLLALIGARTASAAEGTLLEQDSKAALQSLYSGSPGAKALGDKARGILVFPNVVKAGFVLGASGGDGVLLIKNKVAAHYNTSAVSVGFQAGAQSFGYVIFFMSETVLKNFQSSKNFEIGVGPSIVFIDVGAGKDLNTLTAKSDVYGVIFDQKGLMAGAGLQGTKITKLSK